MRKCIHLALLVSFRESFHLLQFRVSKAIPLRDRQAGPHLVTLGHLHFHQALVVFLIDIVVVAVWILAVFERHLHNTPEQLHGVRIQGLVLLELPLQVVEVFVRRSLFHI